MIALTVIEAKYVVEELSPGNKREPEGLEQELIVHLFGQGVELCSDPLREIIPFLCQKK